MTVEQRGGVIIGDSNDHIDEARLISILRLVEGVNGFSIINRRTVNNIPRVTSVGFDKLREANFAFAIVDLNSGKPAAWRMLGYIEAREIPLLVLVGRNDPNFLRMGVDTLEDQIVRQWVMYENEEDITKGVKHFIRTVQTDRLVKRRRLVEGIGINGELSKEEFISNSGLEIDFRSVTVAVEGKPVILTPLEFNLLGCLARGRGMVMSNKYLLQQVWDIRDDENNVHNLRVFVSRMRTKLGESGQKPRYIQNRRGFGYMMPKFEESLAEE